MLIAVPAFEASQLKGRALVPAVSQSVALSERPDGTLTAPVQLFADGVQQEYGKLQGLSNRAKSVLCLCLHLRVPVYTCRTQTYCTHLISTPRPCPYSIHPFFFFLSCLGLSFVPCPASSLFLSPGVPGIRSCGHASAHAGPSVAKRPKNRCCIFAYLIAPSRQPVIGSPAVACSM